MKHSECQDFYYLPSEKVHQCFVMVILAENMIFPVLSELLLPPYFYLSPGIVLSLSVLFPGS